MKKLLRLVKRILAKSLKTKFEKFYWRFRHFVDKKWPKSYILPESLTHPHRKFLIEKITAYFPFENVLEIGCASGPNLYLLAKKFPNTKLYGVDISKEAIKIGEKWLQSQKIKNVFLSANSAENLKRFSDNSMDIIFTDATLIYVGPDKIAEVIKEMLRIAKKAIILNELHSNSPKSFYNDHWIHNYRLLFKKFIPEEKIKLTKIPENLWSGDWSKYGHIIEVIK